MRVRCHAQGKFYTIQCPKGTRVVREANVSGGKMAEHDHLIVPLNGKMVRIPADPPELLPLLAESGNFGVTLVGEPEPDVRLAGSSCPGCGELDVNWLELRGYPAIISGISRYLNGTAFFDVSFFNSLSMR